MEQPKKQPCQHPEKMGEFACADKSQCWEPCGELGKSEEHAVAVRCDDCRSVGALHCAHPDECGGMKPVPNT